MGLSASQARFLQLTKRRSDIEYEAQQINFQRLQLSQKLESASMKYQEATTNRTLKFAFNNGSEVKKIDLSYQNYKNFMNQNFETSHARYFLVSPSGKKHVVASEAERDEFIKSNTKRYSLEQIQKAKADYEASEDKKDLSEETLKLASIDLTSYEFETEVVDGKEVEYYVEKKYTENDFIVDETLKDVDAFQNAIKLGTYYFAKEVQEYNPETKKDEMVLKIQGWETLGGGAISEDLDTSDDAEAQAEYDRVQAAVQSQDKKLELKLDQLETNREAIQTELDSVQKVIDEDIENTFNIFS